MSSPSRRRPHRDEAEDALQAALAESMQPDFMATILQAEAEHSMLQQHQQQTSSSSSSGAAVSRRQSQSPPLRATRDNQMEHLEELLGHQLRLDPQEHKAQLALHHHGLAQAQQPPQDSKHHHHQQQQQQHAHSSRRRASLTLESNQDEYDQSAPQQQQEEEEEEEDPNGEHPLLCFDDLLLHNLMSFLDEDSIGHCICSCKRLYAVCASEQMFERLCRRVFAAQNPRFASMLARKQPPFVLRRFDSWSQMFVERPRVCYNGFYWLKVSYFKQPELNMWSEVTPGTILEVVYYRYFSFQRDGRVLYAMLFRPPSEAGKVLRDRKQHVVHGRYYVDKRQVFVSVPTEHNAVEFVLEIGPRTNRRLTLKDHFAFSEPDGSGWIDYFDTFDQELRFYRYWDL